MTQAVLQLDKGGLPTFPHLKLRKAVLARLALLAVAPPDLTTFQRVLFVVGPLMVFTKHSKDNGSAVKVH